MEISEVKDLVVSWWGIASTYLPRWETTTAFCNSSFFTALIGSLAGAFAGAYAAQRIAEKSKSRDELTKEIRNTNAAIMLSFNICNSLLALKEQHVKPLKEHFENLRKKIFEHKQKRDTGVIAKDIPFEFVADLQIFPLPQLPTTQLQKQVFEQLTVGGRALSIVTCLIEATSWLNNSLEERNQLIEMYKETNAPDSQDFPRMYFGLPSKNGHVHLEYSNLVDSISSYTDDGIFYSQLLCRDLNEHGVSLASTFKKRFRDQAPHINSPDFQKAKEKGLLPSDDTYANWLSCFIKSEEANPKNENQN